MAVTLDSLAEMIKEGFDSVDVRFDAVDARFDRLEGRVGILEGDVNQLGKQLTSLERGQEEIKLKLDNVAYRFELVELQRRVELLEKQMTARA